MLAEDFFVKMKLLIAKAETPKAIKFLYLFVSGLPEKDILSKNKIAGLSEHLHNKTQQLTESLIEKKLIMQIKAIIYYQKYMHSLLFVIIQKYLYLKNKEKS